MNNKEYRQSQKAIIISYLAYRWMLAILTYGILVVYDFLNYRNTKLTVHEDSITLMSGVLSPKPRKLPFADLQSLSVSQSSLGRRGDYGTVRLHLADSTILQLKYIDSPKQLAKLLYQLARTAGVNVQSAEDYDIQQAAIKTQEQAADEQARNERLNRTGKCPRCGSENLQAIVETHTRGVSAASSTAGCCLFGPIGILCGLPGSGASSSNTKRMCLNCGKKF